MTSVNFNEASTGDVNSDNTPALKVKSSGKGGVGVWGENTTTEGGAGVVGSSKKWEGVHGDSEEYQGVHGESTKNIGVAGVSKELYGVYGEGGTGVFGKSKSWVGVYGESETIGVMGKAPTAGHFEGDVVVTGDIKLLNPQNADFAEDFDIVEENVGPGTVMVLTESGSLQSSHQAYDKKVAGVVSGAGGYRPAMVLGRRQVTEIDQNDKKKDRLPIALMGKVYCKVDARHSPIETGDLLTTSSSKGYAMKAEDPIKAFGAVIGKALSPIKDGIGMIPVLVTLQ